MPIFLPQTIISCIEILTIASVIYYFFSFFWNTRAMDLLFGLFAFLLVYGLAIWLQFPVIKKLMYYFINAAVIALLIIFQPELRLTLARMSLKNRRHHDITELDRFIESLTQTIYRLSERRIGALILLEHRDPLDEYANRAVLLHADFSPELLESIFMPTTPLHDGAVIIRGNKILSAATILPLAEDSAQLAKSMGTRHRAALGMSQLADALAIIVSEESGRVSLARQGVMTRGVKVDRFKGVVRSIFSLDTTSKSQQHPRIWDRWIQWIQRIREQIFS